MDTLDGSVDRPAFAVVHIVHLVYSVQFVHFRAPSTAPFGAALKVVFNRAVVGFFGGGVEIAGRQFAVYAMVFHAFAALPVPRTSRIGALTLLGHTVFLFSS